MSDPRDPMSEAGLGVPGGFSDTVPQHSARLHGGKTGSPPGLLQDDSRELSKWLSGRPGARYEFDHQGRTEEELEENAEAFWQFVRLALLVFVFFAVLKITGVV